MVDNEVARGLTEDWRMPTLRGDGPVYILGAGFSRAISDAMPLTNDLGSAIEDKLQIKWPKGYEESTFEEQLTVLSTAMPFLEGYENTERRALAERITAAVARELSFKESVATMEEAPRWLLQIVALWHAEKATVLTFNYDTLVEHAVTSLLPVVAHGARATTIHGAQVVYPSPAPAATLTIRDTHGPSGDSLQLLKLHGSLNWFWSLGDGSTVTRDPYIEGFGDQPDHRAAVLGGTRMLDQFLIPPVLSKDSYYNVNLVHKLWRAAYKAIKFANRITVIGYSMPKGDRIAADLLRHASDETPVDLVNWALGAEEESDSPLGRAANVGLAVAGRWEGPNAVPDYVASRVAAGGAGLAALVETGGEPDINVVANMQIPGTVSPRSFLIRANDGTNEGVEFRLDLAAKEEEEVSPLGGLIRANSFGTYTLEEFYDEQSFLEAWVARNRFLLTLAGIPHVVIDVARDEIGKWPVLRLEVAPA